jgi:hypothetical protein
MRLKPLAAALLSATMVTQLAACGTVFYPERRGQMTGEIDPAVAVLNGIGLLLYVVPGVIAFAVDFATGAIYLPDRRFSLAPETLHPAVDARGEVDPQALKAILWQELQLDLPVEQAQRVSQPQPAQLATLGIVPRA